MLQGVKRSSKEQESDQRKEIETRRQIEFSFVVALVSVQMCSRQDLDKNENSFEYFEVAGGGLLNSCRILVQAHQDRSCIEIFSTHYNYEVRIILEDLSSYEIN